jgi:hypothetical protein
MIEARLHNRLAVVPHLDYLYFEMGALKEGFRHS